MAIYRFKCTLEDYDDLFRVIEIKSGSTFLKLKDIVLQAFGFDNHLDASFFMSDDIWRMHEEISSGDVTLKGKASSNKMENSKLSAFIYDPHQKILLVYDYNQEWTFHLEMVHISPAAAEGVTYPYVFKSSGIAPKQYNTIGVPNVKGEEEDEFDFIKNQILVTEEEEVDENDGFKETGEDGEETDPEAEGDLGEELAPEADL